MPLKQRAKEVATALGIYRPIRNIFGTKQVNQARANMMRLVSTLLPKNCLVFDIGANVGAFSGIYAEVGCKVVAVEPNHTSACDLRALTRHLDVRVLEAAVGAHCGLESLHIAERVSPTSTLSKSFMARMQLWDDRYKDNWRAHVTVPLITLDAMVAHFGQPTYIKIDVEGYEREVLQGLSNQPPFLSFEFHNADLEAAFACLDFFSEKSEFNLAFGSDFGYHERFHLSDWVNRSVLKEGISKLAKGNIEGDIFVRMK